MTGLSPPVIDDIASEVAPSLFRAASHPQLR
jgi:hypothetical protein